MNDYQKGYKAALEDVGSPKSNRWPGDGVINPTDQVQGSQGRRL